MSDTNDNKTAQEILRYKAQETNGELNFWQEQWVLEAMEEYANQFKESYAREMAKKDAEIERLKEVAFKFNTETANVRLTLTSEIERLRGLLGRYANHVDESEGSNFLGMQYPCDYLNENERAEILALSSGSE